MKSSALQQELYEYKNSQLGLNKKNYTSLIDEETDVYNQKKVKFSQELDLKLNEQLNKYKKLKQRECRKVIEEERVKKIQSEKKKLLLKLLDEVEQYMVETVNKAIEQSIIILKCSKKELELHLSLNLENKLDTTKIILHPSVDKTLNSYEFICKYGHSIIRVNLEDEINQIIEKEENLK